MEQEKLIFILGPSEWLSGFRPPMPDWVKRYLPDQGRRTSATPLMIRKALASFLSENGWDALIMEGHERLPDETHAQHFRRIVSTKRTSYFVYWPYGAKRAGLDVELGFILEELAKGEDSGVRLFVENKAGGIVLAADSHGNLEAYFVSKEKGRRTTYYEDLVRMGAIIVE